MKVISICIALLLAQQIVANAQSAEDRYRFVRGNKLGYIDYHGREVIPPRFGSSGFSDFNAGLASVFEAGKGFGYIDPSGKYVIGPTMEWGWGRTFHEGIAGVMIIGKNGELNRPAWISEKGDIIFTGMGYEGAYFSDGLMSMPNETVGKWGFVDKSFKFVIPPQYELAVEFAEGRAAVQLNHKWGFIDASGKLIVPAKYDHVWSFTDGLARVRIDTPIGTVRTFEGPEIKYNRRHGFIDRNGTEVIGLQFDDATRFSEGYAFVMPANRYRWAIIDKRGNLISQPVFRFPQEFQEGLAVVMVKGKYGYVDTSGNWVIRPRFKHAESFRNGLAQVTWNRRFYGYIDKTGKVVWKYPKR
jgi:WG containing repeat